MKIKELKTDFLVIGSGIAGLWFAYKVASFGKVTVLTKKEDTESNTNYAQGGIAAVMSENDSAEIHFNDTIKAGAELAHNEIVRMVVENGPQLVRELYEVGIKFTTYRDTFGKMHFDLGKEGGHTRRRIIHCRDRTGVEIEKGLVSAVGTNNNVEVLENHFVFELLVENGECYGVLAINHDGEVVRALSNATLLATGGIGSVYLHTTNPKIATGDGIAIAFQAGAKIANMEFIQFHPTSLYGNKINDRSFLISEAVRGEGGILKTQDGKTFAEKYHELGSLAPRDVVARAIDTEMKNRHEDYVYLDMTHLDPDQIRARFPFIYETCLKFGNDITKEKIPVVPAAHYVCGGIQVNSFGETNIKRLLAAGECVCSGMHGANRLASNSLLEALFFAEKASEVCSKKLDRNLLHQKDAGKNLKPIIISDEQKKKLDQLILKLRKTMWDNTGIVRSDQSLQYAWQELFKIECDLSSFFSKNIINPEILELKNMLTVAKLITFSALTLKESRGLHYNTDYPELDNKNFLKDTVITKDEISQAKFS